MARVISGTRQTKHGKLIRQVATGGTNKILCPSCHGIAIPAQRPDGTKVLKCQGMCGSEFTSKRL